MRVMRGVARAFVLSTVLVIGAAGAGLAASQTVWFRQWLRGVLIQQSAHYLNGTLTIGALEGNLLSGVALRDVAVTLDGEPMIAVRAIELHYNLWQIATKNLTIDELILDRPRLVLREGPEGWNIARLVKEQAAEADREGPARPLAVDHVQVREGQLFLEPSTDGNPVRMPRHIDHLALEASVSYVPVDVKVDVARLSFSATDPSLEVYELSGAVALKDEQLQIGELQLRTDAGDLAVDGRIEGYLTEPRFDLQIRAERLPLPAVARFVPSIPATSLEPTLDLTARGPLGAVALKGSTRSALGAIDTSVLIDAQVSERSVAGTLTVDRLDLSALSGDRTLKSDISGEANVELHLADGGEPIDALSGRIVANVSAAMAGYRADRLDLTAQIARRSADLDLRAAAYGARLTAKGRVHLPSESRPVEYDLRGTLLNVDARQLPLPPKAPRVATNLNASYRVRGSEPVGTSARARRVEATATFQESSIPGVQIERGTTAQLSLQGEQASYQADAAVRDLDLQRLGDAFDIAALRDDRYRSDIDGHVRLSGSGLSLPTLSLEGSGEIASAQIMGGAISDLTFSTTVHDDSATLSIDGAFADFDPAVVSGRADTKGLVAGRISADARMSSLSSGITADSVAGTARLALAPSNVGQVSINRAALDADYEQQTATIRELVIEGRDANVDASGTLVLGDAGESSLQLHADSARLDEIGKLAGLPISGIARVEATVTGNRQALVASGTFEGDGLKYEENGALTLRSQFSARVSDLQWSAASFEGDSRATFVSLAGQEINEVAAKTTYEAKRIAFDVQAKQPRRQLDAAGALTLHTDHQEVHLDRLALATAGERWEAPAGEAATVRYSGGAVEVEALRLVNRDQEILVEGRVGAAQDTLNATLTNVDLAAIDALLLRPPQFSGRLNATAAVSGPTDNLSVTGTFAVNDGGFRQFTYQSLTGDVSYKPSGVTLDARLQQNDTQWLTAKGYVPMALFTASEERPAAGSSSAEGDRIDLTIDSSPLGLGLIQGFTTVLTEVDGTLEAHLKVTGTAQDPQPNGVITIANGMLTVAPTGGVYTNIAGRLDVQPDRVHIDQIVVLDNHQSALTLTGDLAVRGRDLEGVQLWVNAEDFKILDNDMGNVRIHSALEIAGSLQAPSVRGDLGLSTGRIELDAILAAVGSSPYPTAQTEYLPAATATSPAAAATKATPADSPVDGAPARVATEKALADAKAREDATARATEEPQPSLFDGLQMDIRLTVPDALVVKADSLQAPGATMSLGSLNATLGGDLTVRKAAGGSVRLIGEVNTVRGTYDFQGRRFEILREGTVRFDGGERFDPLLNVRTRREIQAVEARVDVRGTLSQPEIILSSTPPLEQADILSLIVFNQPINQLGLGQQVSLAATAQSLATGIIAGQLASSLGDALHLDMFEINVAPASGAAAAVTLGQQLGKALYLRVEQGLGDVASTNIVVEYNISKWLRLQTNFLQGASNSQQSMLRTQQGTGVDLIMLFTK